MPPCSCARLPWRSLLQWPQLRQFTSRHKGLQFKCKPGTCSSAVLNETMLQSSSLDHFDKSSLLVDKVTPLFRYLYELSNGQVAEGQRESLESSQPVPVTATWKTFLQNALFDRKCLCVVTNQVCIFSLRIELNWDGNINYIIHFFFPWSFNLQKKCLKSKHSHDCNSIFKQKTLMLALI